MNLPFPPRMVKRLDDGLLPGSISSSLVANYPSLFGKSSMYRIVLVFAALLLPWLSYSQSDEFYEKYQIPRSTGMKILGQFSLNTEVGWGRNFYVHDLTDFHFFQDGPLSYIVSRSAWTLQPIFEGNLDWHEKPKDESSNQVFSDTAFPRGPISNPAGNPDNLRQSVLRQPDGTRLAYSSVSPGLSFAFSFHWNYRIYRIGYGVRLEQNWLKALKARPSVSNLRPIEYSRNSVTYLQNYVYLGASIYNSPFFSITPELQVGGISSLGKYWDHFKRIPYLNFGICLEQHISEYLKIYLRPSVDFKNYTIEMARGDDLLVRTTGLFLTFGVSVRIPEIPRSPIPADHIQHKHIVTDVRTGARRLYRGQPFWRQQNPPVGKILRYRRPYKYRLKNFRTINP